MPAHDLVNGRSEVRSPRYRDRAYVFPAPHQRKGTETRDEILTASRNLLRRWLGSCMFVESVEEPSECIAEGSGANGAIPSSNSFAIPPIGGNDIFLVERHIHDFQFWVVR